jgi:hypothetical protein
LVEILKESEAMVVLPFFINYNVFILTASGGSRFLVKFYQALWCHNPEMTIFAGKAVSSVLTATPLSCIPDVSGMTPITNLTHVSSR